MQPVLDRRCVGCHDGKPVRNGVRMVATPDLRAKQLRPDYRDHYSPAYMVLQKYVRRAGFESDIHMHVPSEYEADTSSLVQMLKKGHYNVRLTGDEWERLYTWIDFNVPYPANWRESHQPPSQELVDRRAKHQKLFAGIDDKDEEPLPPAPVVAFEPPAPAPARAAKPLRLDGWPLTADAAGKLQQAASAAVPPKELALTGGAKMKFAVIPAGRFVMGSLRGAANESPETVVVIARPFYLGVTEVTNAPVRRVRSRTTTAATSKVAARTAPRAARPSTPPISRSCAFPGTRHWPSAAGSRGKPAAGATLPTEAQWEWACRAGTATTFSFGDTPENHYGAMNIADGSIAGWNYGRYEPNYGDGYYFTIPVGRTPANAWGLADMHGNAAEWCLSNYAPYPYDPRDGRDDPGLPGLKVVRGGSWNDLANGRQLVGPLALPALPADLQRGFPRVDQDRRRRHGQDGRKVNAARAIRLDPKDACAYTDRGLAYPVSYAADIGFLDHLVSLLIASMSALCVLDRPRRRSFLPPRHGVRPVPQGAHVKPGSCDAWACHCRSGQGTTFRVARVLA